MRSSRTLAAVGIVAAILTNSSMAAGAVAGPSTVPTNQPGSADKLVPATTAVAATKPVPTTSSGIPATISRAVTEDPDGATQSVPQQVGICGTAFGSPGNDAILSWDDTTGAYRTAGAADFFCPSSFTITSVDVMGYYGAQPTAPFNVTVYNDSGGGEPDNFSPAKCLTQTATGTYSGMYGYPQQVTLPLNQPCAVGPGTYWLEVQEVDPVDPWYWQTQTTTGGFFDADWREYGTMPFGTPCTAGYLDGYHMQDCVGLAGEPDFMFVLTGDASAACGTVDQITPLFTSGFSAQSMASTQRGQAADDFVCSGTPSSSPFEVRTVGWKGRYLGCFAPGCGPAPFNIEIYSDDPNLATHEPGTVVCSNTVFYAAGWPPAPAPGYFQESTPAGAAGPKTFQATLSTPCTLTSGTTYWLSVQFTKTVPGTTWSWDRGHSNSAPALGSYPADWMKKSQLSCQVWDNSKYLYDSGCLGVPFARNLFFRIN